MASAPRQLTVCLSLGIVTLLVHLMLTATPNRPTPRPLPQIPRNNTTTTTTTTNNNNISITVLTNNSSSSSNRNNSDQEGKPPSGRKKTPNFYETGDVGGGNEARGGRAGGGRNISGGGLLQDIPLSRTVKNDVFVVEQRVKECKVRVSLSPCPCERTVRAALPRCPGGGAAGVVASVKDAMGDSTCGEWATARGGNQRVISYSLFGAFPSPYHRGIEELAGQVHHAYPGWTMRVHHALNLSVEGERGWLCGLACQHPHLDFCNAASLPGGVGDISGSVGSVWRAAVLGDPLVTRYMIRDADAPILRREVMAVKEWLSSGKCFHVMRDSPHHDQAVMAGLWGGCGDWHTSALPRLRDQLFKWSPKRAPPSVDQLYINMLLWPLIRRNLTAHDSYHCASFTATRPFPTRRRGRGFVGMRSFRPAHAHDALTTPCPAPCRPPSHKNWDYC